MEKLKWKVVHEEAYYGFMIVVEAQFRNDISIIINGLRYIGNIELKYTIYDQRGKELTSYMRSDEFPFYSENDYHKFCIAFKRKVIRYGFLKLRRKEELIHIKDEYERVLPLFVNKAKNEVKNQINKELQINKNNKITEGLVESLSDLRGGI